MCVRVCACVSMSEPVINSDTSESLFRSFPLSRLSCILPLFTGQETLRASQQHHVSYNISLPDTFSPFCHSPPTLGFSSLPYVAAGEKSGCLFFLAALHLLCHVNPSLPFPPFSPSSSLTVYLPFSSHPLSSSLCLPHFPLLSSVSSLLFPLFPSSPSPSISLMLY